MQVRQLSQIDEPALEEVLLEDPLQNLFLLALLGSEHAIEADLWYGAWDGERLRGVAWVKPSALVVPWTTLPSAAMALGALLRRRHVPCMTVGPRMACDMLISTWAPQLRPRLFFHQRLYVCGAAPPGPPVAGFRQARLEEWEQVAANSGRMEMEDLGRNLFLENPRAYGEVMQGRIKRGATWVIQRDGELVFQVHVGTTSTWGCQVGGTYVPPRHRGHGLSTEGMRALCQRLVPQHGRVTLHVNEDNKAAVRCYEKSGFDRAAPFRLMAVH